MRWRIIFADFGHIRHLCVDFFFFFYTESDTKLLYWVMLRFRMSAQRPKTRSNRALSSLTHFSGPRAITVAALGLSSSRAISPENLYEKTSLFSPLFRDTVMKFELDYHDNRALRCKMVGEALYTNRMSATFFNHDPKFVQIYQL